MAGLGGWLGQAVLSWVADSCGLARAGVFTYGVMMLMLLWEMSFREVSASSEEHFVNFSRLLCSDPMVWDISSFEGLGCSKATATHGKRGFSVYLPFKTFRFTGETKCFDRENESVLAFGV